MRRILATGIIVLTAAALAVGCSSQPTPAASKTTQTAAVTRGDVKINITAAGNLVSAQDIKLTFGSSGKVKEVKVGIGDSVKEGDVLAVLDTAALERAVIQARLNLKQAQMNLEDARDPKTTSSGTSVPDPLNIEIMEFKLESSKLDMAEAEQNLKDATITAPFGGLIAELNVAVGDEVGATTVAIRLIHPAKFKVTVLVNEADINKVNVGDSATIQLDAMRSVIYPARVAHIYPVATIQSNVVNYKVEVALDTEAASQQAIAQPGTATLPGTSGQASRPSSANNQTAPRSQAFTGQAGSGSFQPRTQRSQSQAVAAPVIPAGFQLREGQTVLLSVTVDQATDVLLLPNQALSTRGGRTYVQVINAAGVNEERAVQVGISDGQFTQIVSGLQEKDQVSIAQAAATKTTTTSGQQPPGGGSVVPNLNRMLR